MPTAHEQWYGCPDEPASSGTRNGDPCRAETLRTLAAAWNHLASVGRCVFSTTLLYLTDSPGASGAAPGTTQWHFCYDQRNANGQALRVLVLYVPRDANLVPGTNTAVLRIADTGTAVDYDIVSDLAWMNSAGIPIQWPDHLREQVATIDLTANVPPEPDGALHTYEIASIQGFRVMGICVWEVHEEAWPPDVELDGSDLHVDSGQFGARNLICSDNDAVEPGADPIVQLRTVPEVLFHGNRDVYAYSMPQGTTTPGASTYLSTAAVVPTNLVDGSVARTANTWGMPVASLSGGYGLRTQVEGTCRVLAECTLGHTGYVDFVSSLGTATSGAITVLGWYDVTIGGTGKVPLDSTANDKVDLQGYLAAAPPPGAELRVYAWHVDIDPD